MATAIPPSPRVIVVGCGRTGAAAAALAVRLGGAALVTDDAGAFEGLPEGAAAVTPEQARAQLESTDAVVVSPGVPAAHPLLEAASAAGVGVVSELEFAWRFAPAGVLGVTGTNGKSTTVTLLAAALGAHGLRVFAGGNLGEPLSAAVGRDLDVCVLEVSSFQLERIERFRPEAAAWLNLAPDHIDRHGGLQAYAAAKLRLFENLEPGDLAVLGPGLEAQAAGLRRRGLRVVGVAEGREPRGPGEWALFDSGEREIRIGEWRARLDPQWPQARHDFENAAAAAALARARGVQPQTFEQAAAAFVPLPHRLCLAGSAGGVRFWDDSKATNPAAVLRSLENFAHRRVILLAGGLAKGDLGELRKAAARVQAVVAFGQAREQVLQACSGAVACHRAAGMRAAFEIAVSLARPGDDVLLAPACASFDEFADYGERGRSFVAWVEELGGAS